MLLRNIDHSSRMVNRIRGIFRRYDSVARMIEIDIPDERGEWRRVQVFRVNYHVLWIEHLSETYPQT